ncbi:hypothetical protein H8E06_00725 [bacterium]|nr:hypothetical protein [bacterium]
MSDQDKYVIFVEANGRTVYGIENSEKSTDELLAVKNPAVIFVQADQQSGQFGVQVVPFLFREFAKDGTTTDQLWTFNKSQITLAHEVELDAKLIEQHKRIFSAIEMPAGTGIVTPQQAAAEQAQEKVVKLFDESKS